MYHSRYEKLSIFSMIIYTWHRLYSIKKIKFSYITNINQKIYNNY